MSLQKHPLIGPLQEILSRSIVLFEKPERLDSNAVLALEKKMGLDQEIAERNLKGEEAHDALLAGLESRPQDGLDSLARRVHKLESSTAFHIIFSNKQDFNLATTRVAQLLKPLELQNMLSVSNTFDLGDKHQKYMQHTDDRRPPQSLSIGNSLNDFGMERELGLMQQAIIEFEEAVRPLKHAGYYQQVSSTDVRTPSGLQDLGEALRPHMESLIDLKQRGSSGKAL